MSRLVSRLSRQIRHKIHRLSAPFRDASGAVTIDWVVLTAGVVVLIFGIVNALDDEFEQIWDDMFDFVSGNVGIFN